MNLRHLLKLAASLTFIFVLSLAVLGHSKKLKSLIHQTITVALKKDFQVDFSGDLVQLSPLFLSATYNSISLSPCNHNEGWNYHIKSIKITASLLHFILHGSFKIDATVRGSSLFSEKKGLQLGIATFITRCIDGSQSKIPITLGTIRTFQSTCTILDIQEDLSIFFSWNNTFEQGNSDTNLNLFLTDGAITFKGHTLLQAMQGKVIAQLNVEKEINVEIDVSLNLPFLPTLTEQRCLVSGVWNNKKGTITCRNEEETFSCKVADFQIVDEKLTIDATVSLPISYLSAALGSSSDYTKGTCLLTMTGTIPDNALITVTCDRPSYGHYALSSLQATGKLNNNELNGTITADYFGTIGTGSWSWNNENKTVTASFSPLKEYSLGSTDWILTKEKSLISALISKDGSIDFVSTTTLTHKTTGTECFCTLQACHTHQHTAISGAVQSSDAHYALRFKDDPFLMTIIEKKETLEHEIFTLKGMSDTFSGTVDGLIIQKLCHEFSPLTLFGKALFEFDGSWKNKSFITGSFWTHDASLRIPHIYNFMHTLSVDFEMNFFDLELKLKNVELLFQKGSITSKAVSCGFKRSENDWWIHAPIVISEYFLNWSKDLYAEISGALILKKIIHKVPELSGFIIINKATLRDNIFSPKTQQALADSFSSSGNTNITIDLALSTQSPISVKTSQMETKAHLQLECIAKNHSPELRGEIALTGGVIHFPAYSLPLLKGSISFSEDHPQDPFIEIIGQGRIKKYLVTLAVGGTSEEPHILFDSVPALSQEQIMMLLVAGSEEESLNIVAPALIMRNVENLIFGSPTRLRNDYLLQPLKKISFLPRFTDQTGRGGFKAALEIEVSKRLRAVIEKNFSLTEDVSFEVEYLLTDDVCLRATRDERGDLGAGLEMRFKF